MARTETKKVLWVVVGLIFLVGLSLFILFALTPPTKKPVPRSPSQWWDVPTMLIFPVETFFTRLEEIGYPISKK